MNGKQLEAQNLLFLSSLYKTLALGFVLFVPASKLYDCSPNYDLIMTLGGIFDMNALLILILTLGVFLAGRKAHNNALKLLSETE
ncbi:MAG: hypothetical protein MK132_25540 [Lentisphaerales bacterium]|nr:hypothetical protein [Lentisphaerales bacterium]